MSRTSSPGMYSRNSSKSIPRPLKWLRYAPTIMSLTRRLVRTSTRRTDSSNSLIVMAYSLNPKASKPLDRSPKAEIPRPTEVRRPKSESAALAFRLRPSAFGLLSVFGLRISDLLSRHWHSIEDLFNQGIGGHRLCLGFVREDNAMAQNVRPDAFHILRCDVLPALQ